MNSVTVKVNRSNILEFQDTFCSSDIPPEGILCTRILISRSLGRLLTIFSNKEGDDKVEQSLQKFYFVAWFRFAKGQKLMQDL